MDFFKRFSVSNFVIVCIIAFSTQAGYGQNICDSSVNKHDLDYPNPDHSHPIFAESRWRCVSTDLTDSGADIEYSGFTSFLTAVDECSARAWGAYTTESEEYQWWRDLFFEPAIASEQVIELAEGDMSCVELQDGPGADEDKRQIEKFSTAVTPVTRWHYHVISGGVATKAAVLAPLTNREGRFVSFSVEYDPEIEVSHCTDPLCGPQTTASSQFAYSPIEPGLGTLDYTIPIFPHGLPGLVPISMHYSSHGAVRRRDEAYEDTVVSDIRGWHHSYDKYLREGSYGSGTLSYDEVDTPKQIFIRTPQEDLLIFQRTGQGRWENVSHPGVKTVVVAVGGGEYEARRPDGYTERYGEYGKLYQIKYPDGEEINITGGVDYSGTYGFIYQDITRSYPPATTRVYRTGTGEPLSMRSLENPAYGVDFNYAPHPIFDEEFPQLASIRLQNGALLTIDQELPENIFALNSPLLKSVRLNGKAIFSANYDDQHKAISVSDTVGIAVEVQGNDAGTSSVVRTRLGANFTQFHTPTANGSAEFWGDLSTTNLDFVTCANCGFSESLDYGPNGAILNRNRSGDQSYMLGFNSSGLPDSLTFDADKQRSFEWNDDKLELTQVSGTDVVTSSYGYTGGHVDSITLNGGDALRTLNLDRNRGLVTKVSGLGRNEFNLSYNGQGFLTGMTDKNGRAINLLNHNSLGQAQKSLDPNGTPTTFQYDILGNLTSVSQEGEQLYSAAYSTDGLLVSTSLYGQTLTPQYDDSFRVTGISTSFGESLAVTYGGNGLASALSLTSGEHAKHKNFAYDAQGNVSTIQSVYTNGSVTESFNTRGQITNITDGDNITNFEYDENAFLTSIVENGARTQFQRDAKGRLTALTTPGQQITTFDYTGLGEQTEQANVNWGTRRYSYDQYGDIEEESTNLLRHQYFYTDSGLLTKKTLTRIDLTTPTVTENYGYDDASEDANGTNYGVGHLTSLSNGFAAYKFIYNRKGSVRAMYSAIDKTATASPITASPQSPVTIYDYASDGLVTKIVYSSGDEIVYEYDPNSRKLVGVLRNGTSLAQLSYANSLQGATEIEYGNGLKVTRVFDDRDRVNAITLDDGLWSEQYFYDNAGNLDQTIVSGTAPLEGAQSFAYNVKNELTAATGSYGTFSYGYDTSNNRTSVTRNGEVEDYEYQQGTSRLTKTTNGVVVAATNLDYDADGNVIVYGDKTLEYDSAGRIYRVLEDDQLLASYSYDAFGRRVRKKTETEEIYFRYDSSGRLLEETDANDQLVRQYIYLDTGELIAFYDADTAKLYYVHTDFLSAPVLATDENAAIAWAAKRTPFGKTDLVVDNVTLPIRASSQYYDQETGFHYNEQRYYNPRTGRYLRNDPIGLEGGTNPYNFALQNPTKYVDLDGRQAAAIAPIICYSCDEETSDTLARAPLNSLAITGVIVSGAAALYAAPTAVAGFSIRNPKTYLFGMEVLGGEAGLSYAGAGGTAAGYLFLKSAPKGTSTALQLLPEFSNARKAFEHYAKHSKGIILGKRGKATLKPGGADVPEFSSFEAYVSAAKSFWAPSVRHGILQGIRADGAILRFEPATGYFGVMRNGRISTFFRPDGDAAAGLKYFRDQL